MVVIRGLAGALKLGKGEYVTLISKSIKGTKSNKQNKENK